MKISSLIVRLVVLMLLFSSLSARADDDDEVTQLKLQRTQCEGLCPIYELTLNSDGSAQFQGDKNSAREGFYRGTIAPEAFAKLAKTLEDENFFDLRPVIGERLVTDVSDIIISATRKGSRLDTPYTVAARNFGKDLLLRRLQMAFDNASAQIEWTKDDAASKSGVRGVLQRDLTRDEKDLYAKHNPAIKSRRLCYGLVTLRAMGDTKTVYSTRSDNAGNFQFLVPPGKYSLSANDMNAAYDLERFEFFPFWWSDVKWIEIAEGQILPIEMQLTDRKTVTKAAQ